MANNTNTPLLNRAGLLVIVGTAFGFSHFLIVSFLYSALYMASDGVLTWQVFVFMPINTIVFAIVGLVLAQSDIDDKPIVLIGMLIGCILATAPLIISFDRTISGVWLALFGLYTAVPIGGFIAPFITDFKYR